jgi:nucleotide-binding universal stress UspA family protein
MKILVYEDETLEMNLDAVSSGLNAASGSVLDVQKGKAKFRIAGHTIYYPDSYDGLPHKLREEAEGADLSLYFTRKRYDNNYFFHSNENLVIVSFYAWEQLTTLPVENGVVYFVASLVRFRVPFPPAHKTVTGCINDFLWNKTGIDLGMRSGLLCSSCKQHFDTQKLGATAAKVLDGIGKILNHLGAASRNEENIVDYWQRTARSKTVALDDRFAVFLCHNAKDKAEVRQIARTLERQGIRTWLDEEQLRPGMAWQVALEEQITAIETAAVFVGSSGIGPWQNMEIRAFLSEFVRRNCPIIPVILPTAKTVPELPIFLRQLTWVDLREDMKVGMERLIWGITGKKP